SRGRGESRPADRSRRRLCLPLPDPAAHGGHRGRRPGLRAGRSPDRILDPGSARLHRGRACCRGTARRTPIRTPHRCRIGAARTTDARPAVARLTTEPAMAAHDKEEPAEDLVTVDAGAELT